MASISFAAGARLGLAPRCAVAVETGCHPLPRLLDASISNQPASILQ
jgi:hypothetical protein